MGKDAIVEEVREASGQGAAEHRGDGETGTDEAPFAQVDAAGRLVLPRRVAARYGLEPGDRLPLLEGPDRLGLLRPSRLSRLYVEPTNQCNLDCRTCMRNAWDEPAGMMSEGVFDRVIEGLQDFSPMPTVFFGGVGEPLFHPRIVAMVRRARELGAPVELITNGTLLTRDLSRELARIAIDVIWVSIDGATPESYADIRLGAHLPGVVENLGHLSEAIRAEGRLAYGPCGASRIPRTELGIEFVAMKRNVADLPAVLALGRRFDARRFMVTNVVPYTKEMREEALYEDIGRADRRRVQLALPRTGATGILERMIAHEPQAMSVTRGTCDEQSSLNRCPFIAAGAGAISWDGNLSPCLPLMHSHIGYLAGYRRHLRRYAVGNVLERPLRDLWQDPEHTGFRTRVQSFDFAPCAACGGCGLLETNEEDCAGSPFPTCGGCLWAQGWIRCP